MLRCYSCYPVTRVTQLLVFRPSYSTYLVTRVTLLLMLFKVPHVNFQRVRNKSAMLAALISKHNPDVIVGTETHLSLDVNGFEIFPDNFCVHRRDRDCHSSGTITAIRDNLNSIRRSDLETDSENYLSK